MSRGSAAGGRRRGGPARGRRITTLIGVGAVVAVVALIAAAVATSGGSGGDGDRPRGGGDTDRAAVVTPTVEIGVTPGAELVWIPQDQLERQLDLALDTGVTTVRVPIVWHFVEPARGVQDWSSVDRVVDAALARSMTVVGVLAGTPTWAAAPGQPAVTGTPASADDFGGFAGDVAARYTGRVDVLEIWNEPNGVLFFDSMDPVAYTDLLRAASTAIKAAAPRTTVIAGAVGSVVETVGTLRDPVDFVAGMYAAGAAGLFDALSIHPYSYELPFSEGEGVLHSPYEQVQDLRRLMERNGDAAKKIWATEYGVPTAQVDEQTQSDMITDFIVTWQELPYAGPVMIHAVSDIHTGSPGPEHTFGLYRTDGTPKLAAEALRAMLGG